MLPRNDDVAARLTLVVSGLAKDPASGPDGVTVLADMLISWVEASWRLYIRR
ncbi:hypothetical protein N806_12840 [Rhodococcus sp. P27]|nr:hypothetical protein N806_11790 [Rhodococcus sp. P27]ERB52064.1 hypothetical protein N806_12840 [Rhodococcus sp. P27]